ncbi:MAG: hypothetical protein ACTSR3_18910 [Candidatus Helarchaeota archaeon]
MGKKHKKKLEDERKKFFDVCDMLNCDPWIAIFVDAPDHAELYITDWENDYQKYRSSDKQHDVWEMNKERIEQYKSDPKVKHIRFEYNESENWFS